MIDEDRLSGLLRDEAEHYRPAGGRKEILARLARLRHHRLRRRRAVQVAVLGAVVVAVSVAVPALIHESTTTPQRVTTAPSRATPAERGELLTVGAGVAETIDADSGRTLRSVSLHPSLPQAPLSVSVDPTGTTAYVSVEIGPACSSEEVVRIALATGDTNVVIRGGADAVVSPDGKELAFVDTSAAPGASAGAGGCGLPRIATRNLITGTPAEWLLGRTVGDGPEQVITSLSWSPDGQELAIGSYSGPHSGIQILNASDPIEAGNPVTVGPGGSYLSPVFRSDGTLAAISPFCELDASCPAPNPGVVANSIVSVDLSSGDILNTLVAKGGPGPSQPTSLITDPSGQALYVLVTAGNSSTYPDGLYAADSGRLRLVLAGDLQSAWLPGTQTSAPSARTSAAPTRHQAGTVEVPLPTPSGLSCSSTRTKGELLAPAAPLVSVDPNPAGVVAVWNPGMDASPCLVAVTNGSEALARKLASSIVAGPAEPSGLSCPVDDDKNVSLYFRYEGQRMAEVVQVALDGCEQVSAPGVAAREGSTTARSLLAELAPPDYQGGLLGSG